jgi:hypothetical protein
MKKDFKDMLDRPLKVGQIVLNVWVSSGKRESDFGEPTGPISSRLGRIIKFNEQSVRIKHKNGYSNIFNSTNRLIIMSDEIMSEWKEGRIEDRFELMEFD